MALDTRKLAITKLDAAQRQLKTAIWLWFMDGDPVSIHTLAYAAYEIIHATSKRLNPSRKTLLFDTASVREEFRAEFNATLKRHANFFKHANRQEDDQIDFHPVASELFIMFAILGIEECRILNTDEEATYLSWIHIHHPEFLTEKGREVIAKTISVENLGELRLLKKHEFFEGVMQVRNMLRGEIAGQ